MGGKPKLLLHVCCAPCVPHVAALLGEEYAVTLYFFNPNIHPETERVRRLEELRRYAEGAELTLIEGPEGEEDWRRAVKGLEGEPEGGARCAVCFRLRLDETAREAALRKIPHFTTTLTVSPHKNAKVVNAAGRAAGQGTGAEFLERDFKKRDGYRISCDESKKLGFYRQHYCGCEFSRRD